MDKCWICDGEVGDCGCNRAANDNAHADTAFIRVPPHEILAQQSSLFRLAMAYAAMDMPRRSILDFLTDQFISYAGIVVDARGKHIDPTNIDVDGVFRTDDDPSERWLSNFLHFADKPPARRAQDRILPRLQVLWLGLAICHPYQAQCVIK